MIYKMDLFELVEVYYFGEVVKWYWYVGINVEVGFIIFVFELFCVFCMRVRILVDGKFYMCLFVIEGLDVREFFRGNFLDEELLSVI